MHYVDESGQPLSASATAGDWAMGAGPAAGILGYAGIKSAGLNLGMKGFGSIASSKATSGMGIAAAGLAAREIMDAVTRSKEAKIYEEAYTDESVGAMDFTGQQF